MWILTGHLPAPSCRGLSPNETLAVAKATDSQTNSEEETKSFFGLGVERLA